MQHGGMTTATATLELTLGEALKVVRERAGLTQKDMADRLELGRNTVARYESAHTTPRWRDVVAWAEEVGEDPTIFRAYWDEARRSGWLYVRPPDGWYEQPCLFGGDRRGSDVGSRPARVA